MLNSKNCKFESKEVLSNSLRKCLSESNFHQTKLFSNAPDMYISDESFPESQNFIEELFSQLEDFFFDLISDSFKNVHPDIISDQQPNDSYNNEPQNKEVMAKLTSNHYLPTSERHA